MSETGDMSESASSRSIVPPVQRALRLLRHIAGGDPVVTPTRTAKHLGINRTTLVRLLTTLEDEGMIEKRREGSGYTLGPGARALSASALFSADILRIADPILAKLAVDLGLSSHLGILDGRSVVYLLKRVPNLHLVSNIQIGSRVPAHSVNAGRIILAYLPKSSVQSMFAGVELEIITDKTPRTVEELLTQIDQDRQLGLAWSDSNFEVGISSVAAPVFDHLGNVVGSINVTGANASFDTHPKRRAEIARAVHSAATEISSQLGLPGLRVSAPIA